MTTDIDGKIDGTDGGDCVFPAQLDIPSSQNAMGEFLHSSEKVETAKILPFRLYSLRRPRRMYHRKDVDEKIHAVFRAVELIMLLLILNILVKRAGT